MAGDRRKPAEGEADGADAEENDDVILDGSSDSRSEIAKLRGHWELASVLNFLSVYEPVIGKDLKISAEEIEEGLIKPNSKFAQLHISILKGIPPVSKTLNDAWITALCKKLAMWWPWVAEGEIPLTAAKGVEISRYRELDPTNRLLILKALCEIRADQDDAVSYVNDAMKDGYEISYFRKDEIGGDGNGTSYWYDGDTVFGHRLYREVKKPESKTKSKGKQHLPAINFQWETLATNLEEFRKVVDELSSTEVAAEVAVGKAIETDCIPVLEKLQKKKERALKRIQRQQILLNGFVNSYGVGVSRSCRNRRPVCYTFDEYDRAIDDAIKETKKRKSSEGQRQEGNHRKHRKRNDNSANGGSDTNDDLKESSSGKNGNSVDSNTESDTPQEVVNDDDNGDDDYDDKIDDDIDNGSDQSDSDEENNSGIKKQKKHDRLPSQRPVGVRWSKRLTGDTGHLVVESRSPGTKSRLRQRPTSNSALDSVVVPDSDDDNYSKNLEREISTNGNSSPVADSEEVSDS